VSGSGAGEAFWDRLAIAKAHIGERGFPPVTVHRGDPANSSVKIGDFAGWVVSKRWEIPEEMRALAAPGLRERLELVGGNLSIESNSRGSTLAAEIPELPGMPALD